LSTQAEVAPTRIIKAGPAIMHKKGWRSKRRVWMELSHDMMCAYASNREDAKTHPVGTILCERLLPSLDTSLRLVSTPVAFINKLLPFDPKAPRYLRVQVGPDSTGRIRLAEFDTEESTQDWRRELSGMLQYQPRTCKIIPLRGAIFLHRHRRRQVLSESDADDSGIRLSCPLNRIQEIHFGGYPDFSSIATLGIIPLQPEEGPDESDSTQLQAIHLGPIKPTEAWKQIDEYVNAAKQRALTRPIEQYPVFIDFGSLDYNEAPLPWDADDSMVALQERFLRGALSLDSGESKLWSEFSSHLRSLLPAHQGSQSSDVGYSAIYHRAVIL
jgi:sterol 3beta-glucosyltransferase